MMHLQMKKLLPQCGAKDRMWMKIRSAPRANSAKRYARGEEPWMSWPA